VGTDKDFLRFSLGDGSVVPGFQEAVTGMRPGGVRRVIVPVELGYPGGDFNKVGPKPTTFSVREERERGRGREGEGEREREREGGGGVCFLLSMLAPNPRPALTLHSFPLSPQGKRALSFVLKNQGMIDKTLMFDIELLRLNKVGRTGVREE
jgi:hypothetical protein